MKFNLRTDGQTDRQTETDIRTSRAASSQLKMVCTTTNLMHLTLTTTTALLFIFSSEECDMENLIYYDENTQWGTVNRSYKGKPSTTYNHNYFKKKLVSLGA